MSSNDLPGDSAQDRVVGAIGDAKDTVASAASDLTANVTSKLSDAKASTSSAVQDAASSASSALGDAKASVKSNPIGLLIGGVVVGAVVAAFLPVTETERRKVQPIRDDVVGRVTKAKDDVVKAGRGVLEETYSAASQAVNKHSGELAKELESDFKTGDEKSVAHDASAS